MTKARDLANSAAAFAAVSATELGFVDGVTSAIQTQMDAKAPSSTAATLTGTQTLTNKTLTSPALTTPTISTATTNGDILYGTGSGALARLGIGSASQVLSVSGGIPAWATASSGSLQVAGKNAVLNGDFFINQRTFTSNTTTNAYNFDRWFQQNSGGSFTVTPQTFTPGAAPIATYEGRKFLQGITASQSAAGDYAITTQRIEDVTRYAGTTVTISFFAKANTGTPKIGVEVQQNFGSGGSPSATVSTPAGAVTLSTSFARYEVSVAVPSLSGKTLGTTATTSYLELNLWTSSGATNATRASSIGVQNFTASIWGVQLEYATAATYFTTATGNIQAELAACMRYYIRQLCPGDQIPVMFIGGCAEDGATTRRGVFLTPNFEQIRVAPTISLSDYTQFKAYSFSSGTGYVLNATPSFEGGTQGFCRTRFYTGTAPRQDGVIGYLHPTASNQYIEIIAEL